MFDSAAAEDRRVEAIALLGAEAEEVAERHGVERDGHVDVRVLDRERARRRRRRHRRAPLLLGLLGLLAGEMRGDRGDDEEAASPPLV